MKDIYNILKIFDFIDFFANNTQYILPAIIAITLLSLLGFLYYGWYKMKKILEIAIAIFIGFYLILMLLNPAVLPLAKVGVGILVGILTIRIISYLS